MRGKEYHYQMDVRWTGDRNADLVLDGKPVLPVAPPPEFGGPEGVTSPEDLFVASAVVCFWSTFLVMAKKADFEFETFSCGADGKLEFIKGRGLLFTKIDLYPKVTIADRERIPEVEEALVRAKKYCLVTNSMNTEVEVHSEVEVK